MSERGDLELVADMREAIARIERYTAGRSYETFLQETMVQDAVVRNLEILGEAAKRLSPAFRSAHDGIAWTAIAGMRDRLIHHYAGVNWDIVWDVVVTKLPALRAVLSDAR